MQGDSHQPTWLVTGANGFLGANLGAFLAGRVHRIGVTRTGSVSELFDAGVEGELANPAPLCRAIEDLRPAVVINTDDLAQGIINAINDSQSDNTWGQHARARALETWSPATVVYQYLDVYARAQK